MPISKTLNQNFFKKWSRGMAYMLGFFAADGSMYKTKRETHFIEFQITDRNLLKAIQNVLRSNHKISMRSNKNKKWKDIFRLQVGSKTIFADLINLGLTQAKSKTLKMPKVPDKYFSDFVRGYFDGDGNVTVGNYLRKETGKKRRLIFSGFICGNRDFLKEIHNKLKKLSGVRHGMLYHHDGAYRLYFSINDSFALYNFMYANIRNKLFLPRKRRKFESYFRVARIK